MSERDYFVHPSAYVDEPCEIGAGTHIWHFCHVMKGAGSASAASWARTCVVGGTRASATTSRSRTTSRSTTGVDLEDDVFCGPSCVFTNVTNPRSQIIRHSLYQRTWSAAARTIGANATIVCGTTIGRYAFIAAGAVVTRRRAGLCADDGRPGAAARLDEPPRPPTRQPRCRRRHGLPGERLALPGGRRRACSAAWISAGRRAVAGDGQEHHAVPRVRTGADPPMNADRRDMRSDRGDLRHRR